MANFFNSPTILHDDSMILTCMIANRCMIFVEILHEENARMVEAYYYRLFRECIANQTTEFLISAPMCRLPKREKEKNYFCTRSSNFFGFDLCYSPLFVKNKSSVTCGLHFCEVA